MKGERKYILLNVTYVSIIEIDKITYFSRNKLINTKRSTINYKINYAFSESYQIL